MAWQANGSALCVQVTGTQYPLKQLKNPLIEQTINGVGLQETNLPFSSHTSVIEIV